MKKPTHPLRAYREGQHPPLTQEDLAKSLGVTKATVSRWEGGERFPERQFWTRIREVTGIGAEKLSAFTHDDDEAAA